MPYVGKKFGIYGETYGQVSGTRLTASSQFRTQNREATQV
jgi:hypothetical protein